jgi:hypothetical protein
MVFLIGGFYGLIVTVPLYFMESRIAVDAPPPLTHAEYFYAFIGVTAVWQILFLVISRNPVRYRPLMIVCAMEKTAMLITFLLLYPDGRFPLSWIPFLIIDMAFGALFLLSYARTKGLA